MRHRNGFILSLFALIMLLSLAGCSTEPEQPPGRMFSDGTIRSGRDTVWVKDDASNAWMLYMLMSNNGRTWYAPPPHAITYHHVYTRTASSAPLRTSPAYRYVSPRVKPYTSTATASSGGQRWNPSARVNITQRTSTAPAARATMTYTPRVTSPTSAYRPSTSVSTFRSSPSPSIRIR